MSEYQVTVTVRLEATASFAVSAKNEEAAEEKVQALLDEGKLVIGSWKGSEPKGLDIEWDETDQIAEIDTIDEE